MKFHKQRSKDPAAKKTGHNSPMQKKDWAKNYTEYEEAVPHLVRHVRSGASWSGNDLVYLNALWDAVDLVARELGYLDADSNS